MSLDNLVKTHQLARYTPRPVEVQRLLAAARRNLADARVKHISDENRFDCAYKTIMQCALVGLLANGYRPATSTPGHHQTMIQALPLTLGVGCSDWLVLDALRKKRNVNDYSGDLMEPDAVANASSVPKRCSSIRGSGWHSGDRTCYWKASRSLGRPLCDPRRRQRDCGTDAPPRSRNAS